MMGGEKTMKNGNCLVPVACRLSIAAVCCALCADAADFDVRGYGAKGDGVTFDTEAVQKAIDACSAPATGATTRTGGL